jgi:hypothetical protein
MTENECRELIRSLATTPDEVRRLAEGFSLTEMRWNPPGGEFSVVENVCHLRDIEVDGYAVRIKRILVEENPLLSDIDGAKLAQVRNYRIQDLSSALAGFAKAREENVRTIQVLTTDQLARSGTFEITGAVTLGRMLGLMREHDAVHLGELTRLRSMLTQAD